jgi:hypothetical protein
MTSMDSTKAIPETVQAQPEGAPFLVREEFLVPTHPFPDSDHQRMIHGEVQKVITLIYAMLDCGMDIETIKERILWIAV